MNLGGRSRAGGVHRSPRSRREAARATRRWGREGGGSRRRRRPGSSRATPRSARRARRAPTSRPRLGRVRELHPEPFGVTTRLVAIGTSLLSESRRVNAPYRASQRDLRVPRNLAQPAPPPQLPGLAVPDRVREPEQDRRGLKLPASPLRRTRGTSEPPPDPVRFSREIAKAYCAGVLTRRREWDVERADRIPDPDEADAGLIRVLLAEGRRGGRIGLGRLVTLPSERVRLVDPSDLRPGPGVAL